MLDRAIIEFDKAGDRWRQLYKDAVRQRDNARHIIDRSNRGGVSTEDRINAEASEKEAKRQIDLLIGQSMSNKRRSSEFEFYPYRYFAAEGFLPGFNFPRLPVRAYIPDSNGGEFIARPRVVAIRELAPTNIVYYEGNKFQINKTKIPVSGIDYKRVKIDYKRVKLCANCGYFHEGEDFNRDLCSNCGAKFQSDSYGNLPTLTKVLPMETALTRRRERITSDEEERLKYGYNITTHFRYAEQRQEPAEVISNDGEKLLKLTLGETADIWRINRGLKRGKERGFKLDTATGFWGDSKSDTENLEKLDTEVHLLVTDTCNILVIQPEKDILPQENSEAFLTTLQYALERSIQAYYKLEENELASEKLGEGKYLLFWEAAEGGAGVLSQTIENPKSFQDLAETALDICHFKQPKETCSVACYECLLSYRNQFDHPLLDRHLIQPFLEKLTDSKVVRHSQGKSRDEQYQQLLEKTDPSSEFERIVLKEIYQRGIKLPNDAQVLIPEANCQPDFVYQKEKIAVFCDGSVHDTPEQQEKDRINDENLEFTAGYHVCRLRYDLDLTAQLDELASWV
ncbi:MAG: DUF1998 domain-containing protein [Okeania sp. SIO2D1]|nr:DUF1998 domain-containing protein [Okeania sp. SIO2D1]